MRARTGRCAVWAHSSGEDARRGGRLVACIWRARRLYQQDMHLPARHGAMLDSLGYNEYLALIEDDRAIPKLDVERTCEHKEEIVGVVVFVPVERPFELGDHYVVAVVDRNHPRGEAISEGREPLGKMSGHSHHGFDSIAGAGLMVNLTRRIPSLARR